MAPPKRKEIKSTGVGGSFVELMDDQREKLARLEAQYTVESSEANSQVTLLMRTKRKVKGIEEKIKQNNAIALQLALFLKPPAACTRSSDSESGSPKSTSSGESLVITLALTLRYIIV